MASLMGLGSKAFRRGATLGSLLRRSGPLSRAGDMSGRRHPRETFYAGQPLQLTAAGLHPFRRIHTVVVVVDQKVDPATAHRLAKMVKEALQNTGRTCASAVVGEEVPNGPDVRVMEEILPKVNPEAQSVRDAGKRKHILRRSKDQRILKHVHLSVRRLAAGNAPPRLPLAFSQLSSIKQVLESIKSEADEAKKKLDDEKLWIYAVRDRLLDKLPHQVRVWYHSLRALWDHGVDLYPFVVLVVLLSTYSPFLLFGMALLAHDKYLEEKKKELLVLAEEYEELSKKKDGTVSCVGNEKTAVSTWVCVKSRFVKAVSSSAAAAQAPEANKDGPEQATPVVSTPPPPPGSSKEVLPPPPPLRASKEEAGAETNKK